jgi:hypothetical protein
MKLRPVTRDRETTLVRFKSGKVYPVYHQRAASTDSGHEGVERAVSEAEYHLGLR